MDGGTWHIQNLAMVCRRWMLVASSTNELWTHISADSFPAVAIKLQRSGNLPLRIRVNRSDDHEKGSLALILPHRRRIRSLQYEGEDASGFKLVFGYPTPTLERLDIIFHGSHYPYATRYPLQAPALRHLHLRRVPLLWMPADSHLLQSLILSGISLLWEQAIGIFRDLPDLLELQLTSIGSSYLSRRDSLLPVPAIEPLHLLKLRKLVVKSSSRSFTALLGAVYAESLEELQVEGSTYQGRAMFEDLISSRDGRSLLASVLANKKYDSVAIRVDQLAGLSITSEDRSLEIKLMGEGWLSVLTASANTMPFQTDPTPTAFEFVAPLPEDGFTISFLDSFPAITSLSMYPRERILEPCAWEVFVRLVMEGLLIRNAPSGRHRLPDLRSLKIGGTISTESDLDLLYKQLLEERRRMEQIPSGPEFKITVHGLVHPD